MADTKISALTDISTSLADADLFVAVDVSDTSMAASGTDKKLTASNLKAYVGGIYPHMGSGRYWGTPNANALASFAFSTGELYFTPLWVPVAMTVDRISINVQSGIASGTVRLGIYSSNANGVPASLLLDAGTVATTSSGVKEATISQALTPGIYWLAAVSQTAGATLYYFPTANNTVMYPFSTTNGAFDHRVAYKQSSVTGALPGTPTLSADYNQLAVQVRQA